MYRSIGGVLTRMTVFKMNISILIDLNSTFDYITPYTTPQFSFASLGGAIISRVHNIAGTHIGAADGFVGLTTSSTTHCIDFNSATRMNIAIKTFAEAAPEGQVSRSISPRVNSRIARTCTCTTSSTTRRLGTSAFRSISKVCFPSRIVASNLIKTASTHTHTHLYTGLGDGYIVNPSTSVTLTCQAGEYIGNTLRVY
eukprot:GDKK01049805.1.p1 GENE.GDKK01049805.1~~GDKK01049805.1.p1  ORF type:complete len:198 (-),score=11.62 GDKK01049805.1:682-1275(-)